MLSRSVSQTQASRRTVLKGLTGLGLAAAGCSEALAETYPSRVIEIVVPTSAGGGGDTIGRLIGQQLQKSWGQSVVIENKPGAGGTIGSAFVAKSVPDGYTLLACTNADLTINSLIYTNLSYDPLKDFTPITALSTAPFLLVVHPSLPVHTVAELVTYAKAHPNEISYSSSGVGTATHLAGVLFNKMAGIETIHIPYRGSAPAMGDLVSGRTQMRFFTASAVLPFLQSGELRAIAVTSTDKYSLMPELPTVAATIPGYSATIWYALVGPAGMPEDVVNIIQAETAKQLATPEVTKRLVADGSQAVGNSPAQVAEMMKSETAQWSTIIRENNIHAE